MKTKLAVLLIVAAYLLGHTQSQLLAGQIEHAPSVDQCRADQRLWSSQQDDYLAKQKGNRGREAGEAALPNLRKGTRSGASSGLLEAAFGGVVT